MKNRYKLPVGLQRDYLIEVEKVSGFSGDNLAKLLGIVGRSYRDWKRGRYSITQDAVEIIEEKFGLELPYSKKKALQLWRIAKIEASRKGGLAVLKKYNGPGTPEGRSRGGKHAMAILRARGLVPQPKPFNGPKKYSIELAEFVGILLGDGHIGKEQWSVTLNSIADKDYLTFVVGLIEKLFGFSPSVHFRKDSKAVVILGSGIRSIEYLKNLDLKVGNKITLQVGVPSWIELDKSFSIACLRGLIDTDGGIFIHRYKINGKEYQYLKLSFVNRSMPLLNFVYKELEKLGFNPRMITAIENKRVWLYNQQEVKRYLEIVGTNNPRLLKNCTAMGWVARVV